MQTLGPLAVGCEFQPFIDPHQLTVCGYEALARFKTVSGVLVPPNQVFDRLHRTPTLLAQIEYQSKQLQIRESVPELPLFLNLDPHGIDTKSLDPMLTLLASRAQITVEIIENTSIHEAEHALTLVTQLQHAQIQVALDDVGATHAMLSLALMSKVDCIKFDRYWLNADITASEWQLLEALVGYARRSGKCAILEGVETQAHLNLARTLGVDLVQGFLFRDRFIQPPSFEPLTSNLALS